MKKTGNRLSTSARQLTIAGFFLWFYCYCCFRVEPSLRHDFPSAFLNWDSEFFPWHLADPGGLAHYLAVWLAQLDYTNPLGAAVSTGLGACLYFSMRGLIREPAGDYAAWVAFVPAWLFLGLQNSYAIPVYAVALPVVWALGMGWMCAGPERRGAGWRLMLAWSCAVPLGYAGGWRACLLFAVLCGLRAIVIRPRAWAGFGGVAFAAMAFVWRRFAENDAPPDWGADPESEHFRLIVYGLYAAVPLALLLSGLAVRTASRPSGQRFRFRSGARFRWVAGVGLFLAGWLGVWMTFDRRPKELLQVAQYSDREQWDKVIEIGAKLSQPPASAKTRILHALYRQGRLSDALFSFPWVGEHDLLPGLEGGSRSFCAQSAILLELGQVNCAERLAHEALECEGARPEILRWLVRINLLNDRPEAARVFLNVLREIPFARRWVDAAAQDRATYAQQSTNPAWAEIRANQVLTDQTGSTVPLEMLLRQALHSNPRNRMAFEYLTAQCLLTLQTGKVAANFHRLESLGFTRLPQHCAEALLLERERNPQNRIELPNLPVSPELSGRFAQFMTSFNRGEFDSPAGRQAARREYGDTYWLYYLNHQAAATAPAARPANP